MSGCRQRKVVCEDCGYTARVTRSWMERGLGACWACGGQMMPTEPADLAWLGLIGPESMPQRDWNAICRENGWDIVRNQGQEAQRLQRGGALESIFSAPPKAQCAYAGCGRWIRRGADHCTAGHPQSANIPAEIAPF